MALSGLSKAAKVPSMKFAVLRSIGHNIADSLASGIGLMIGEYEFNVFEEAHRGPEGHIEVDFLTGTTSGAHPSETLARVVAKYRAALPDLCRRQGASVLDFRCLTARYGGGSVIVRSFTVTVQDHHGRRAVDDYHGTPGARPLLLGPRGEIRRKRVAVMRVAEGP